MWEDQWLPVLPPQNIISPCLVPNMTVAELIIPITGTWDEDKLSHLLLPEDIELVQRIRLSKYNRHDQYVWPYTTNMEYTVKSGYWTATHDFYEGDDIVQPEGSIAIKRMIWKLDILPQIQHFLWRTVSGVLPTYVQLCSRGINIDPDCQICCLEEESINHTLFLCPHHLELGNILYDICHWMSLLPMCSLELVNREKNMAADVLFKHAFEDHSDVVFIQFFLYG